MEVGLVISGLTAHGSFVSPGLSSLANLSAALPHGPALMVTVVGLTSPEICVVFCCDEGVT